MIIIDLIKELMYQQNKTIDDIVDVTRLPYETVYRIVNNDIVPSPEVAKIILGALGISLEDVLTLY